MALKTKLYLTTEDGEKYMGIGVVWLLEGVRDTGSLLASAKRMGMSYSKAHGMVEQVEKVLKRPVIERRKGGSERQGALLTPFAEEYIRLYRDFEKKVKDEALEKYESFEKEVLSLMEKE